MESLCLSLNPNMLCQNLFLFFILWGSCLKRFCADYVVCLIFDSSTYIVFNGILQLIIYIKEKNAILFTYPPTVSHYSSFLWIAWMRHTNVSVLFFTCIPLIYSDTSEYIDDHTSMCKTFFIDSVSWVLGCLHIGMSWS